MRTRCRHRDPLASTAQFEQVVMEIEDQMNNRLPTTLTRVSAAILPGMIQKVDNDQKQCGANVKESADVAKHSTTLFDVT